MTDWQPIETAPRNGTEICAWVGENNYFGGWLQLAYVKINGSWSWRDWDWDEWNPTHWMKLPEAPKKEVDYSE